nr:MAG TPA: hypothetical protein [Caudoviricetes sp.]
METVFKKGMKVYDQLVFPDKEGEVISVVESDDFPIKVHYEGLEINELSYTADGRYYTDIKATLATKPYIFEGFEQKAPAPTYEEVVRDKNYIYLPENLVAPNKELADTTIALLKLLFLRDYYNEDWKPDWKDDEWKYIIENYRGEIETERTCGNGKILAFKSKEIRDKFLEEQKELLEIAKPLL